MNLFNGRLQSYKQSECKRHYGHDFEVQDDSFDHEFGTEVIVYYLCQECGKTEPFDYNDDSGICGF